MWGDFVEHWRVQRFDVHCAIIKKDKKCHINNSTKKTRKNRKWANLHPKTDLLKITKSKRHGFYYGLRKNRSRIKPGTGGTNHGTFLTIWRHMIDLGSHVGAHWILKGFPNRLFYHKRVCRKVSSKEHDFGMDSGCHMGGLDKPKQAFRIIRAAQYEFSWNCEM